MGGRDGQPLRMQDCTPYIEPPMTPEEIAAKAALLRKRQQEG